MAFTSSLGHMGSGLRTTLEARGRTSRARGSCDDSVRLRFVGGISCDARRHPLGVGGCRQHSIDWRGVSFGSPLCVAVKRPVATDAARSHQRQCHQCVTLPLPRAARHVKPTSGAGNGHAPPYATIPMLGGIAISSYTGGLRYTCHCVRRRVLPRANSSHSETVLQQAAAQGTQCEAATDVPSGCGDACWHERTARIARRFSSEPPPR